MAEQEANAFFFDSMYTEDARLQTFKNWPFDVKSSCSAVKMAEAGFFHCHSGEPDLVQCYVCFKELDGWESTDEPWSEHLSHSNSCIFAQLKKPQKDLSVSEIFKIESQRKQNKLKKVITQKIKGFRALIEEGEDYIHDIGEMISKLKKN